MQVRRVAVAGVADIADHVACRNAVTLRKEVRDADHVVIMVFIPEIIQDDDVVPGEFSRADGKDAAVRAGEDGFIRSGADVRPRVFARALGTRAEPAVLDAAAPGRRP